MFRKKEMSEMRTRDITRMLYNDNLDCPFDLFEMQKDFKENKLENGELIDKYLDPTGISDEQKAIVAALMAHASGGV
jgi:hypothetical protein